MYENTKRERTRNRVFKESLKCTYWEKKSYDGTVHVYLACVKLSTSAMIHKVKNLEYADFGSNEEEKDDFD